MTKPLFDIFEAVPKEYDLVNRVFTWGQDRRWRNNAAKKCLENRPELILDLCTGTGDLACTLSKLADGTKTIVAFDYSPNMIACARKKAAPLQNQPRFVIGNAAELPFPDAAFESIGISFAFRNLTYKNPNAPKHLAEIARVLKPGGRFVIIESSQPESKLIRWLNHLYLRIFVAKIGSLLSGNSGAYRYLAESAARYYTPAEIKKLLTDVGFSSIETKPFLFGAVALYVAIK